jgi:hypothetical protein
LSAYLISDSLAYRHDLLLHLYDSNVQSINKVLRIIRYPILITTSSSLVPQCLFLSKGLLIPIW